MKRVQYLFLSVGIFFAFSMCAKSGDDASAASGGTAAVQTAIWAQSTASGASISRFNGIAVDSAGNVFACGRQNGTGAYGYGSGVSITGGASQNPLFVKYNASGTPQSGRTPTAGGLGEFLACVVDSSNNLYAVGYVQGPSTMTFDTGITATGSFTTGNNALIVKYNSSGVAQWARTTTAGAAASTFNGVAVDSAGNIYAVGFQSGTGSFTYFTGITATGSSTAQNALIVKYDSSGTALWAQTTSAGTVSSEFKAIRLDSSTNVYAVGYQSGTGGYTYSGMSAIGTSATTNAVVVKFNNAGAGQWARTITAGSGTNQFNGVATDSSGNIYAAGQQSGTSAYSYAAGISAAGSSSSHNVVLVKYDTLGAAQWARSVSGTTSQNLFNGVSVDGSDNIFAVGRQHGADTSATYGTGVSATTSTNCCENIVAVKYNTAGTAHWARTILSADRNTSFGSVVADSSGVYAAGYRNQNTTITFGNDVSVTGGASGSDNVLIVKYNK